MTSTRPESARPGTGLRLTGRLVAAGALLAAALAGCGESGADTASSRPVPPAAADQPGPRSTPDPAATGAQTPRTSGEDSGTGPGDPSEAEGGGGAGAGGTGGQGDAGTGGQPGGQAGTSGADGTGGSGGGDPEAAAGSSGPVLPNLPSVAPSPVFLGEACDPGRDAEPAVAVNGLVLYCVEVPDPQVTGADPGGVGRWSPGPPAQGSPDGPEPGGECDPADVGKVVRGTGGRPLSCLREPDGAMRWADVS